MEPAACCWSFADEHLHWVLEHTPARRLLSLATVARQWHAVVAELMRLRARASPQQWSAAMACGPGRDFSTKAKARAACLELLSRATRHALTPMRMLPDLAIVFVSDATKHADAVADVANALASLLPPSTLVLAASATGVLGPLMDERSLAALKKKSREHSSCGRITEVEDSPAVAVTLATLPGVDLTWACVLPISPPPLQNEHNTHPWGEKARFGRAVRHAGAWWLPPGARPALSPALPPAQRREEENRLRLSEAWRPTRGVERPPGMLVLESASFDDYNGDVAGPSWVAGWRQILHEDASRLSGVQHLDAMYEGGSSTPVACAAGGLALACALRPPCLREVIPEEAGVILLKLDGCGAGVCLQDQSRPGADPFREALDRYLQGDHLNTDAMPEEGLGYFSSSSAAAAEPRLQPAGGVLFTCNGRGARFHKAASAEARGLEAALPGVPFIGMFVGGEFGPRGSKLWPVGDEDEEGYQPGAGHSYHTAAQPHGLPRVYAQSFCSVVTMFG